MSRVGIDGCRGGWIAVEIDDDDTLRAHYLRHIDAIALAAPKAEVIGIDMPIGLPVTGVRLSDAAARAFLGPRRHSVFQTPPRSAVRAATHADATAETRRITGAGLSRQAYGLRHKILEVEQWLEQARCPVFEVHPEISFALMLGHPAPASKKTWAGVHLRWEALRRQGIAADRLASGAAATAAAPDDMLDAAAVAWSACRLAAGTARCFPDPPEISPSGLALAIWA